MFFFYSILFYLVIYAEFLSLPFLRCTDAQPCRQRLLCCLGDMGVSFSGMQLSDSTGDDHESSSTLDFLARFRLTQPADDEEEEEEGIEVNNPLDFSSMQLFRMSGDGLGMEDVSNTSLESGGGVEEKATTPASSSNFAFISSVTSSAEYGVDSNLVSTSSDSGLQEKQHRTVVDSLESFRKKDRHVSETKEVVEPDKSYSLPHRERSSSVRDTFNIEERIRRCQIEFRSNLEKERSRGSSARNEYRALYLEKADYLRKLEEVRFFSTLSSIWSFSCLLAQKQCSR